MLTRGGTGWLLPAVTSYLILGGLIYWGNRRVYLVPYAQERKTGDDGGR